MLWHSLVLKLLTVLLLLPGQEENIKQEVPWVAVSQNVKELTNSDYMFHFLLTYPFPTGFNLEYQGKIVFSNLISLSRLEGLVLSFVNGTCAFHNSSALESLQTKSSTIFRSELCTYVLSSFTCASIKSFSLLWFESFLSS